MSDNLYLDKEKFDEHLPDITQKAEGLPNDDKIDDSGKTDFASTDDMIKTVNRVISVLKKYNTFLEEDLQTFGDFGGKIE